MAPLFVLAALGLLALAAWLLLRRFDAAPGLGSVAVVAALFVGFAVLAVVRPRSEPDRALVAAAPGVVPRGGYVGSTSCRSCHPGAYASWHDSYHRSMTALPAQGTVHAPWDQVLEFAGRVFSLERRENEYWVRLPDLDLAAEQARSGSVDWAALPTVERRMALVTGSHHYQAFWVGGRRGNELRQLPFVFHLGERRWLGRNDAFLQPPEAELAFTRWNSNCIQCHAVAGRPAHDLASDEFRTEVIELGVACEACHGPGERHVRKYQNPLARYRALGRDGAPTSPREDGVVLPTRLGPERSAQICGQCHAYFVPTDEASWWERGFAESFAPGEALAASRRILSLDDEAARRVPSLRAELESVFWPDGTMRVGGREYNGLIESPCYERGSDERRLTCVHCHSMHDADPDDQLKREAERDQVCLDCHAALRQRVAQHSRHGSAASAPTCYDCHMPETSYALLKGIRSHRVSSPNVRDELGGGPPNACNLCHLDRPLAWTAAYLSQWYGQGALELATPAVPEPVQKLLAGNAAERVILAYAAGRGARPPSAAGTTTSQGQLPAARPDGSWLQPVLAQLLTDPYSAVRWVAWDALRRFGEPSASGLDPHGPADDRVAARRRIQARTWRVPVAVRALFDAEGRVDPRLLVDLTQRRDDRPISISE